MAITLEKIKVSVNLSAVVDSAVDAVRAVRSSEQARKEADFQQAIADGLSYDGQVAYRQKQLEEEKNSSISDPQYIEQLTKSISDTKRLNRFAKYRGTYATALANLSAGKTNEEQFLNTLKDQLVGIEDTDLRLEIQNNIADATAKVKTYQDTILSNQVKKAQYDGTEGLLNDAISRVKIARTDAVLSNNEDAVTAYDVTLSALQAQLSTTKIQDSVTDFQVTNATRGTTPLDKLNFINQQLSSADSTTAIKVGDRSFNSAAQYWQIERENYLAGNSKVFGDFFTELENKSKNDIAVDTIKHGYPTAQALDSVMRQISDIKSRAEVQPYLAKLDTTQAAVMGDAVDALSKKIVEVGEFNTTFREADQSLKNVATKYGIDTSSYQISLANRLANLVQGNIISPEEAKTLAPDVNIALPTVPTPPVTPLPGAKPAGGGAYTVKAGDNLSTIAKNAGISLGNLLELNPQFKANPSLIKPGQTVNLPGATPAPTETPAVPSTTPPTPTPTPTPTPATPTPTPTTPTPTVTPPKPSTPAAPTVTPPATPATPTPTAQQTYVVKSGDTLSGIALKLLGDASRYKELATLNGIADPNKIQAGATIKYTK